MPGRSGMEIVDVDLSRYFDSLRHGPVLGKVARRVSDGRALALIKQFLKSTGERGVPQGSPLSPLLANPALSDLDHALDRGAGLLTYVRYLDDMIVLVPDSEKGRRWADRALERIRLEAEALGVSLNAEETRIVSMTEPRASFAFLGFDFRRTRGPKTGWWYASRTPRPLRSGAGCPGRRTGPCRCPRRRCPARYVRPVMDA